MPAMKRVIELGLMMVVAFLLCLLSSELLPAQEDREAIDRFENTIRPVLINQCLPCHNRDRQEGGLDLTQWETIKTGGDSGAAVVAGQPEESLLLEAINYESLEMPPEEPLPEETRQAFQQWVAAGAYWPAGTVLSPGRMLTEEDGQWWAVQPLQKPLVPEPDDDDWSHNEIDKFVLARMTQHGIRPAQAATPERLARRIHFAVTGLPPSPDADPPQDLQSRHWENWIQHLLDKPSYGENQARYWLDLVRYADSDGYRADHYRPEAQQYRDYVIESFNQDRPYDQFLTQQLAGDETEPDSREAAVATMYLRHWIYEHNQRDVEGQWQEILDDITETTADAFLALGLKCARCHDHKFDPLLQQDYFRLKAFFTPLLPREDRLVASAEDQQAFREQMAEWKKQTAELRQQLQEIERPELLKHATREGFDKFVVEIKEMVLKDPDLRTPYEHQIASMAQRQYDLLPEKLPEWLAPDVEKRRQALRDQLHELDSLKPEPLPVQAFTVSDVSNTAPPTCLPGDTERRNIEPGFPTLIDAEPADIPSLPSGLRSTGRRTALAEWITRPDNPLTARVMVNRVWKQHFGRGLVENVNDFGRLTAPPSHPELLDWLACTFMEDGWSLKRLHQRILSSATYQQTSFRQPSDTIQQQDPNNRLLWKFTERRLSAEEICDAMLWAAGELESEKRSIYEPVMRNSLPVRFQLFDFPDRIRSCGQRHRTTTSPQALNLMNNSWIHQRVASLERNLPVDDSRAVQQLYRRFYFRDADSGEVQAALEFLHAYQQITPAEPAPTRTIRQQIPGATPGPQDASEPEVTNGQTSTEIPGNSGITEWIGLDFPAAHPVQAQWTGTNLPTGNFTIEAIAQLESLYPDASVRTLLAHWNSDTKQQGWSLGVTSTKSGFQPRNLILQLVGTDSQGQRHYEVVASNLRVQDNRPYYVAVSVDLQDTTKAGITFYLQDLSKPEQPLETATAEHRVIAIERPELPLRLGGRGTHHFWDGPVFRVRLTGDCRTDLSPASLARPLANAVVDTGFMAEAPWARSVGNTKIPEVRFSQPDPPTAQQRARHALIHALLNANEMIYVD